MKHVHSSVFAIKNLPDWVGVKLSGDSSRDGGRAVFILSRQGARHGGGQPARPTARRDPRHFYFRSRALFERIPLFATHVTATFATTHEAP